MNLGHRTCSIPAESQRKNRPTIGTVDERLHETSENSLWLCTPIGLGLTCILNSGVIKKGCLVKLSWAGTLYCVQPLGLDNGKNSLVSLG
jgi:hypothetical protein